MMSLKDIRQIGIVGGSVSSLMLCIEAAKRGIHTSLLDPKVDCVGSRVATEHLVAPITAENVKKLSLRCDCVIYNTKPDFKMDVKLHSRLIPSKETIEELYQFKNILEILELLEIPTAKIYSQQNDQEAFKEMDRLEMPFRFIKQYENSVKQLDVFSKEDLADFIMETEEQAEGFILQPLSGYKQIAACICMVDASGRFYAYHPIQEETDTEDSCQLRMGQGFTKNMIARLTRYNKKLLKELNAVGVYTIKYGIKANKAVEFIEITPELGVGSLLTTKAYEYSIFEQYLRLALEMKPMPIKWLGNACGKVTGLCEDFDEEETCHLYDCGVVKLCISSEEDEA